MATDLRTVSLIMAEHVAATRPRTACAGQGVDADSTYAGCCRSAVKHADVRAGGKASGPGMARLLARPRGMVEWGSVRALVRGGA